MKNNYLISTGGSGGHVVPATIFYEHLYNKANLIMTTDKRGLKYLNNNEYKFNIINTPKLSNILLLPFNFIIILFLIIKSFFLMKKEKIQKIISTGGYMSLPLIFAAKIMNLDIYLIEPNQIIGRANRFFLKSCTKIFCYTDKIKNFPKEHINKIVVINPLVKKKFYDLTLKDKNNDKFNILIVGGSQGAKIFDEKLKTSLVKISKKLPIRVFQQSNESNIQKLADYYSKYGIENKIFSFEKNSISIFQNANLCITRAGASTLAELSILNIPFLAVPLPSSKDNHQFENANYYKNNGCCWILEQKFFNEKIEEFLENIINNKSDYIKKKENLKKLNYLNNWINVNQKILKNLNEY